MQRDLHFTQASLAWVIDAYLITFGGALLLAGRLGDLIGRKKVFLAGVTLFTIASALCGAAASQEMLIAARFVQGLGAALSASVILAMIVAEFPDQRERTKAMSAYVLVSVGGGSLGLLLGGVLTQALSWHWIFFINLPIGVATAIAGALLLDENPGIGIRAGVDVGGAVLSTGGVMLAIYTIVTSTQYGWGSAHTIGFGAAAVIVLLSFFLLESRLANPLIPLRILRAKGLGSSSLARGLTVVGLYSLPFHRRPAVPARSPLRRHPHGVRLLAPGPRGGGHVVRGHRLDGSPAATQGHRPGRSRRGVGRPDAVRLEQSGDHVLPSAVLRPAPHRGRRGRHLPATIHHWPGRHPPR